MKRIRLTNGGFAIVSDKDHHRLSRVNWYRDSQGYVRRHLGSGNYLYMHRAVLMGVTMVDHANGNKIDNRRCNLRECTMAQNLQNGKSHRDAFSKYKGVSYDKSRRKWAADIMAFGKRRRLGRFDTEREAAEAYATAAKEFHGQFAKLM